VPGVVGDADVGPEWVCRLVETLFAEGVSDPGPDSGADGGDRRGCRGGKDDGFGEETASSSNANFSTIQAVISLA
jgi:hypothetical protein